MSQQGLCSSSSRTLRLKVRADLETSRQVYQGRDYWVIKDPIALKYYRFEEEEYALLKMLDGNMSPDSIKQRFDKKYSPQKITLQELFQFVGLLYRSNLLISEAPGQGVELKSRGEENRKRQRRASLTNVLAIRIRGFDPDGLLRFLDRIFGWFFSIPALIAVLIYAACALALVLTQWELFQNKLPQFQEFFAVNNWFWLAMTLACTKILHELGHGISCRHFGGQCHEMGVMFLVMTPCLYCNVSDSWTIPSKWKRASIGAAGMYVEFFLASSATFIWWFSEPGFVNLLALNVIFVCSVSTLLFNANPLLRYDGYYILSDLIEVPNLRQKASSLVQRIFSRFVLGLKGQADPFLPTRHKWFFCFYSVAAVIYRWLITFAIFWFLYQVLEPYGFKIVGQLIALFAIYGLVAMPIMQLVQFVKVPGKVASVKKFNLGIATVIILIAIVGILAIPLPHYVYCNLYVQAENSQKVYVDLTGRVVNIEAASNKEISEGQAILQVENIQLRDEIVELENRLALAVQEYKHATKLANYDQTRANEINQTWAAYEAVRRQLEQKKLELNKLVVRAPASGIVRLPPRVDRASRDSGQLSQWAGTPLDQNNVGAQLLEGTLVCEIEPKNARKEIVLALDQTDIEFIQSGQVVEIQLKQRPGQRYQSRIENISPVEMDFVPKNLSARFGGEIVTQPVQGKEKPQATLYQVRVPVEEELEVMSGATGIARIRAGNRTVGQRIWRMACETFRFHL